MMNKSGQGGIADTFTTKLGIRSQRGTLKSKSLRNNINSTSSDGEALGKRIRDATLHTFIYHYIFAAKSKSLII